MKPSQLPRIGALNLLALAVLLSAGCSSGKPVVTGSVKYQGQPLETGEINIIGPDGGSRSGLITKAGTYQVDDPPLGAAIVTIVSSKLMMEKDNQPAPSGGGNKPMEPARIDSVSLIPTKYNDPQSSGLHITIAPGRQNINFDLED